jgi:phosphatidylglycerophosphatase C
VEGDAPQQFSYRNGMRAEALIEILEATRKPHMRLAFDADGTLWAGDVGNDVFEAAIAMRFMQPVVTPMLRDLLTSQEVTPRSDDPNALADQLYEAYREGKIPDGPMFDAMTCALAGHSSRDLLVFCRGALGGARLERRVFSDVAEVVAWAKRVGVGVTVVSASPREAVVAGVALLGLQPDEVIAQTLATRDGLLEPRLDGAPVFGPGKVTHLNATANGSTLLAAFGDSAHDIHMMRIAALGVGVAPSAGLIAEGPSLPRFFTMEGVVPR